MAEVVATVIGITTFGVKLVDTLYDFGCNVSSARGQSARIGDRLNDYITILEILAGLLEDEAALISKKASSMVEKLCSQSEDLFYDIKDLLPLTNDDGKVAWLDCIKWNFRKPKVEMLLGQIEYIKTNVLLLVMTTMVGKRIRRKKDKRKSQSNEDPTLQHQTRRAQNAIVQHINAGDKLAALEKDLEQADATAATPTSSSQALVRSSTQTAVILMSRQVEALARFQNSMTAYSDAASRQAYVMDNSALLLKDLLGEWTTVTGQETAPPTAAKPDKNLTPRSSAEQKAAKLPVKVPSTVPDDVERRRSKESVDNPLTRSGKPRRPTVVDDFDIEDPVTPIPHFTDIDDDRPRGIHRTDAVARIGTDDAREYASLSTVSLSGQAYLNAICDRWQIECGTRNTVTELISLEVAVLTIGRGRKVNDSSHASSTTLTQALEEDDALDLAHYHSSQGTAKKESNGMAEIDPPVARHKAKRTD